MREPEIVWLVEERTFARLVQLGAFFSVVEYTREGIDYEVVVTNDEFDYWEGEQGDNSTDG